MTQPAPSFCARRGAVSLPRRVEPEQDDARARLLGDLRQAGGHCVGRPALEGGVLAHVDRVGAGGGELARRGPGARAQGRGADAEPRAAAMLLPPATSSRAVSIFSL